jgi:hypothetical protein
VLIHHHSTIITGPTQPEESTKDCNSSIQRERYQQKSKQQYQIIANGLSNQSIPGRLRFTIKEHDAESQKLIVFMTSYWINDAHTTTTSKFEQLARHTTNILVSEETNEVSSFRHRRTPPKIIYICICSHPFSESQLFPASPPPESYP